MLPYNMSYIIKAWVEDGYDDFDDNNYDNHDDIDNEIDNENYHNGKDNDDTFLTFLLLHSFDLVLM